MSYQVLARKWRPANFSQVAGQGHVLKSLINALDNERLHHAYLFTGTRGVGKTTLARILAKCLNCEEGISSTPCEKCNACVEINEGRFVDLIEVDAASRTKVDDTRELLDNVQYTPSRGRFKVYLIDEVHMLSNHSFNALLKTLEEPPPHVKFLFATTDPQKLPVTILSRCLQFNLKNLSPELIVKYLIKVLEAEQISFDEDALWQIAAAAAGSMRDALTLVDQAIAYCQGDIKSQAVVEMLGVPQHQQVVALLQAMADRDAAAVLQLVAGMAEQTPDYANTLDSLLSSLHRIALAQIQQDAIDNSFGDREEMLELASRFSAEDIQLYYQLGNRGKEDLRLSSDLRSAFEMLLLRMLIFSPRYEDLDKSQSMASATSASDATADETVKKKPDANVKPVAAIEVAEPDPSKDPLGDLEAAPAEPAASDEEPATEVAESRNPAPANEALEAVAQAEADSAMSDSPSRPAVSAQSSSQPDPEIESESRPVSEAAAPASQSGQSDQPSVSLATMDHAQWLKLYPRLPVTGIAANVLANCVWDGVEEQRIKLLLDETQSAVFNEELIPRLEQSLAAFFAEPVTVVVSTGKVTQETPAGRAQRLRAESHQSMVEDFQQDENVQQLLKRFSGSLSVDSIAPVKD